MRGVPEVGLSRVCWVRIVVAGPRTVCVVGGIAHRRPVVRRVSLATATSLASSGVPAVVRHSSSAPPPTSRSAHGALTDAGRAG